MSTYKERIVKKWEQAKGPMSIKNIEDSYIRENLAQLLENQEMKDMHGQNLFEGNDGATNTGALDGAFKSSPNGGQPGYPSNMSNWGGGDWRFRPVALALQRRTFPDLFANKVVGVQAMSTPVGLAYALRFTYAKDGSGVEAAWDDVNKYSGYSGFPGAVHSTSADYDTGRGHMTSAGEQLQIADSRTNCLSATCAEDEYNQLGLRIDQQAIEALTRKLAASFSLEAAQDIKAMHGIDIEREMVNVLQYEITAELDRELLQNLKRVATKNPNYLVGAIDIGDTVSPGSDLIGRWNGERYMSIISAIVYQAQQIAISTRRGAGNFVIVSPDIATALQAAGHQFVNYTQNVNPTTTMAAIGKLNGTLDVYRDQYASTSYALVGYKGPGVSDAGVIFAPYIMGISQRAVDPSSFSPRIGVMSRYAITDSLLGADRYYRLIPFVGVNKLIPGAK